MGQESGQRFSWVQLNHSVSQTAGRLISSGTERDYRPVGSRLGSLAWAVAIS
jgi:hypothetical protein